MLERMTIFMVIIAVLLLGLSVQAQDDLPLFDATDCFVLVPSGYAGTDLVECGYVTVPENREDPDNDRTLRIAVVVMHPRSDEPLPDPMIYLDGGPGGAIMNGLTYNFAPFVKPILDTNRSVIMIATRGVSPSEPAIEPDNPCDAYPAQRDFYNGIEAGATERYIQAWTACYDALGEITDLSAYHATEIAADANAVRQALGYEQVNLWGQSYGTRIALTILRDYPETVRSALLTAPMPADSSLSSDVLVNTAENFERFFATCEADPQCSAIIADIRTTFFETAAALNADPIILDRSLIGSTESMPYVLDGKRFAKLLPFGSSQLMRYVPLIIKEASEGRLVEAMQAIWGANWHYIYNDPLTRIVACNEGWFNPYTGIEDIHAFEDDFPEYVPYSYVDFHATDFCSSGYLRTPPQSDFEPVVSDVPTLILVGEFDFGTPPSYAERIGVTLDNAFVITVPYGGHSLLDTGPCFYEVMQSFLNDPMTEPATSCLEDVEKIFSWARVLPRR